LARALATAPAASVAEPGAAGLAGVAAAAGMAGAAVVASAGAAEADTFSAASDSPTTVSRRSRQEVHSVSNIRLFFLFVTKGRERCPGPDLRGLRAARRVRRLVAGAGRPS